MLWLRVRSAFGYTPNVEWLRATLNRRTVIDRARAHAALAELERCIRIERSGARCRRLHGLR
jgi:hypothetical protein